MVSGALGTVVFFNQPAEKIPVSSKPADGFFLQQLQLTKSKQYEVTTVADVVTKATAFYASLTTSQQQATLQQTYTTALARKWSNLPCGSQCRNGIQISTLSTSQLALALQLIQAAAGTSANEGYDEFLQIRAAEEILQAQAGGNNYDEGLYFICFLNAPSTTTAWMLQYGGHHYAANIAFNGGNVVGTTPRFEGVEPTSYAVNGTTYAPLAAEHDSMAAMLASLSASQLATAKITSTYSDVTLAPGETNGGSGTFPTTKVGLAVSTLSDAQKLKVVAAMAPWTKDVDDASGNTLLTVYQNELNSTYIAYTGNGTSGNASSFLTANTNYVRIDGTSVWIEFICQTGVVFPSQIHFHSVWRDHSRDYGKDLTNTALPVSLLSFSAVLRNSERTITWTTAQENNVNRFEIEYAASGNDFIKIGSVPATNTSGTKSYSFVDKSSSAGIISNYRIKIIDNDGNFKYSTVAVIKNVVTHQLKIFPNPVNDILSITAPSDFKNATIKIVDLTGKTLIVSKNQMGIKAEVNVRILASGHYMVNIDDNGLMYSSGFIKK